MPRFVKRSSRRLVAVLALATTTAVPALAVIAGQTPASVAHTLAMVPTSQRWH